MATTQTIPKVYRWDDVKEGKIEIVGGRTTGESAKLRAEAEKIIPLGSAVLLADLAKKLYGGPVKSGKATYLRHVFSKGGFVLEKVQGRSFVRRTT